MYVFFRYAEYKFSFFWHIKKRTLKDPPLTDFIGKLSTLCCSCLSLSLEFSLKRLESSVCWDVESLACLWSKVNSLSRIKIKK